PASYLAEYQAGMRRFLGGAAKLFAPSLCARDIVGARFPEVRSAVSVIEHGHQTSATTGREFGTSQTLNVAVIGSLDLHKGSEVFRDLLKANRRDGIVFHLYGTTADADIRRSRRNEAQRLDGSRFVYHVAYEPKDIVGILARHRIDVGLHLSICADPFSY